jgi:hypothetical protein
MLSMSAIDRQGQMELNIGKAFINTRRVNSAKFGFQGYFCCVEKRLRDYRRKWKMFQGRFSKYGNSC